MQKKFNRLWVFGDSHSTPSVCVSEKESFWGIAASTLDVKTIINCSRPALSFDSVVQILIGEQPQYQFETDFFIICLPPLERITVFDDYKDTAFIAKEFDTTSWIAQPRSIESHRGLINLQYKELDKVMILISDRSWLETQILRQIFLVTQWLDSNKANYCIINVSKNLDRHNHWGPSDFLLKYCLNHSRCRLFDHSLYDVNYAINEPADFNYYGWFGHHGPAGNRLFFEKAIKEFLC